MKIDKSEQLTPSQLVFIVIGSLSAIESFELPNILVKFAGKDSWMAVIAAAIYPIYIIVIGGYIIKKHPNENILDIYKKSLGGFFGNALNIVFLLQYFIYIGTVTSTFIRISSIYTVTFLPPPKICIIAILVSGLAAFCGLKVVAKINELVFYLTIALILFTIPSIKTGNILNLLPIFKSGIAGFVKATRESLYYYATIELLLLIHPYLKNKKSAAKNAFTGILITVFIFTWIVVLSIYALGISIVGKSSYPFLMVTDTIPIPIFNNLRTIYMFLWNLVEFLVITNEYFFIVFIINNITGIDIKKLCMYILPLLYIIPMLYLNEHIMAFTFKYLVQSFVVYNVLYVTTAAILSRAAKKK